MLGSSTKPPVAVQLIKNAVRKGLTTDLDTTLDYLEWAMLICRSTGDAKEGPRAWREKRPPVFTGRQDRHDLSIARNTRNNNKLWM